MIDVQIRDALVADGPSIIRQWIAMLRAMEAAGGHPLADETILRAEFRHRFRERLDQPNALCAIAETETRLVGMIDASILDLSRVFRSRRVVHIHAVFVEPAQRRQGIARRLIGHALDWGRENDCQLGELNVLPANPARRLYESIGFTTFNCEMILPLR